ncbi:axonemal dynein heavy chain, putative [Perkinsus marinus ATCC 50983]|uniref:Axonemal dynein heavy chain, putative n=1 Tax=Perkinsus marinus (strain ATCC 50983 / TXsc) TaxID=423536 RepID=C5LU46_PERM5|nr:axonemal dynein heavy chain, putative [Perkinsus marinus ATCC 50983]EEQ99746.1 axonemal dynein heavy chain, putative [Perkinsus marinus ATCC 50983]|eukprot:XP_002767029.1 axonemal dynein heavy chain, putative [Perkinsus marinus ATCC 50983]
MVNGIAPREAVERLKRFKEEFEVRSRKQEIYYLGEDLFGLPHQQYPKLEKTKQELGYLAQLYDLYVLVLETIKEWKDYLWTEVPQHIEDMRSQIEVFSNRCKKMPKQLREWPAYHELKKEIEDFSEALPLLVELAKPSIMPRHWQQVQELTGKELPVDSEMFMLQSLIDANLQEHIDEVTDICDSADKQLIIEKRLADITKQWSEEAFLFGSWKSRDYDCVLSGGRVAEIQEMLEEALMQLNTMNAMRHSLPFKEPLQNMITSLSEAGDIIERWVKVQMLWTSLESVFTGGDIAKQMPMEAKKFIRSIRIGSRSCLSRLRHALVVPCCQNDLLQQLLPVLGQAWRAARRV